MYEIKVINTEFEKNRGGEFISREIYAVYIYLNLVKPNYFLLYGLDSHRNRICQVRHGFWTRQKLSKVGNAILESN